MSKKRIINIVITLIILLISFYYTNKMINIFREQDPIMIEIKKYDELYSDSKVDSIIDEDSIIPGIKGSKIDINKSYSKMKKTGKFNKNLLVFKETIPENNINNRYDKYIISLNKEKHYISIIIELNNINYIEQILSILNKNNVNVTFFVSKDIFDNNLNIVKQIIDNGNEVELLSDNYTIYEVNKYNSLIKMISNNKLLFCMNKEKNNELLKSCETTKLYSIVPKQNINNLYSYMKNNLENGMIILLSNKKSIVNELSSTLSYIKQKGKNLILLKSILE